MKNKILIVSIFLILASCKAQNKPTLNSVEKGNYSVDYVPNEEVAIKIAQAVWHSIYEDRIEGSKPYKAILVDDLWIVKGTLNTRKGGVPYIEIQKKDGKILKVTHGK